MGFDLPILQPVSITSGPVVSVSQFGAVGDGTTDDTAAIQSALNYIKTNGGTLNFEARGTYIVSKSLVIAGADDFKIDGNGATIKMANGAPVQWGYSVLRIDTCDNFAITELTVDGNRANRSPAEVPAHNIIIKSSHDFSFSDVKSLNAVNDGFYLNTATPGDRSTYPQNGLFLNCQADNGFRQGMSIINGENIHVIGGAYTNTNGTPPAAGIDIEANEGTAVPGNHNILIRNVTFSGNDGYGVQLSAKGLPTDITIEGCYFSNNDRGAIRLNSARTLIKGNTFEDFSLSERGVIDLGAAQTNSDNIITGNCFNNINTGKAVIFAHQYSGTNNQVYDNKYYDIDGPFLQSGTTGTTGWDNVSTSSPTYPPNPTEPPGNESLGGGSGNDTLDGGAGADTMAGGAGNDTYLADDLADQIIEGSGGGTDEIRSTVALTEGTAYVENYTFLGTEAVDFIGNSSPNRITGTAAADTLNGNAADDTLIGDAGADSLVGGAGADSLIGGVGDDTYVIDSTTDKISETGGDLGDTVQATIAVDLSSAAFSGIENVTLIGASAINAAGSGIANHLVGSDGANVLDGRGGADTLEGGKGNDTYLVDRLADQIVEQSGSGTDEIRSTITLTNATAYVEDYTFLGKTAVNFIGNSSYNRITGTVAADTLNGASGDDTLIGGAGNDALVGGSGNDQLEVSAGNDTVRYTSLLDGSDVITGFDGNRSGGQDVLDLDALFDSLGIAAASRAGRLSLDMHIGSVGVNLDADGDGIFESVIVTLNTTDAVSIGEDIVVGT